MSDVIAWAARRFGWVTWYHVTFQFPVKGGGSATVDTCVCVRPWLRQGKTFGELREYLKEEANRSGAANAPNIVSITRIGA